MGWDKHSKPPADSCPEKYCFMWVSPGGVADMSGHLHDSLQEALKSADGWVEFPDGGCRCSFGVCMRLDPVAGDRDWYEPCESELKLDGLPWFYFIPSADKLVPGIRAKYLRQSRALWGDEQRPV